MSESVEYRVRPVTRFIVTKFTANGASGGCGQQGEFDNWPTAYAVGYALARADHERLGYPPADMRVRYPDPTPPGQPESPAAELAGAIDPSRTSDLASPFRFECRIGGNYGAINTSRPALPGEDWRRGNDVADGSPKDVARALKFFVGRLTELGRDPTAAEVDAWRLDYAAVVAS